MTEPTHTARDDLPAIAAYAAHHGLDREAAETEWGFTTEAERGNFRAGARAAVAAHKADGIAAGRIADLLELTGKLQTELREQTRDHDQMLEEIFKGTDAEPDMSDTPEDFAVRYVRELEAETTRLACVIRDIHIAASNALKSAEDRADGSDTELEDAEPAYSDSPRADPSGHDPHQFPTLAELGGEKFADYPESGL